MKRLLHVMLFAAVLLPATFALAADKVLMVMTSHGQMGDADKRTGFWLAELTHPYYVINNAGYGVDLASIEGGPAPIDPRSMDTSDVVNRRFLKDTDLMAKVFTSLKLSEVNADHYAAVIFVGGHGTMWDFPGDSSVNEVSARIYEKGGVVGAVCHGPAALTDVTLSDGSYLIDGKRFAAFTNEEEKQVKLESVVPFLLQDRLIQRGGIQVSAPAWQSNAVSDRRVVTGQNPQSAHRVGELVVEALRGMKSE